MLDLCLAPAPETPLVAVCCDGTRQPANHRDPILPAREVASDLWGDAAHCGEPTRAAMLDLRLAPALEVLPGVVWCGAVRCAVAWCGVVWCGALWRGVV
eukprot:1604548-Prorocentrum_lima.AAC.1